MQLLSFPPLKPRDLIARMQRDIEALQKFSTEEICYEMVIEISSGTITDIHTAIDNLSWELEEIAGGVMDYINLNKSVKGRSG